MALITVCDIDGKSPATSVTIHVEGRRFTKDLCDKHVSEMIAGAAEVPRRGRPKKAAARKTNGRGRPKKAAARKTNGRRRVGPAEAAA
jgi:hypothetical protein